MTNIVVCVKFVLDLADKLAPRCSTTRTVFGFDDRKAEVAEVKDALLTWALAALVWLVGGCILDRIIRP